MNIFSNIGITELIVILLLALLVVGPERLPEMGRKLAKTLRDVRRMYENLTKDLGPELMSLQQTTRELRESVESVRSIPKDMVDSVVKAADLDDTVGELKGLTGELDQMGKSVSQAKRTIQHPMRAVVDTAREAMQPPKIEATEQIEVETTEQPSEQETETETIASVTSDQGERTDA
jgi:sec-independent protein translocase protein TatB